MSTRPRKLQLRHRDTFGRFRLAIGVAALAVVGGFAHGQHLHARDPIIKPPQGATVIGQGYSRDRINVKFKDGVHVRLRDNQLTDEGHGVLSNAAVQSVFEFAAGGIWLRSYPVDETQLQQLRNAAQQNLGREIADLNLQFELILPAGIPGGAAGAIDRFNSLDIVEIASPVPLPVPSPVPPSFQSSQLYLNAATAGVDAVGVWNVSGVTGASVRIVDIEYSWNYQHQDLPPVTHLGLAPTDPFNDKNHGTAVLGEMASLNNGWGTTGIAHGAQFYTAAASTSQGYNVGGAIMVSVAALSPGDIILIEQQMSGPNGQYVPVEWNAATYNAIVTAVGNGITVVEAAGNGGQNLDSAAFSTGNGGHWPFLPQNDSGAIIVGAGAAPSPMGSTTDRSRLGFSTYGSTVDLQGWGESVMTCGYGGTYSAEGVNLWYTSGFSGTSSASPIVAGACALMQSKYKAAFGAVMSPALVRETLRNTGSPQQNGANPLTQNIGPRPNVTAAIATFVAPPPVNNWCEGATIAPAGTKTFSTISATTDGPEESVGQISNDIWFKYLASCTGTVTVSLCPPPDGLGSADFDARLAVYVRCPEAGVVGQAIASGDDECGTLPEVTFHNEGTHLYRIRIGSNGDVTGTGVVSISCVADAVECAADIAPPSPGGDGQVDIDDLLTVIASWGQTGLPGEIDADVAPLPLGDGQVNVDDLLMVVNFWGACA